MDKTVYYKSTVVGAERYHDMHILLEKEFGFEFETHDSFINVNTEKSQIDIRTSEAHPINIDTLIGILQEQKAKGATHVELEYNVDNIGYDVTYLKMENPTEKEISLYKKREREHEKFKKKKNAILAKLGRDLAKLNLYED